MLEIKLIQKAIDGDKDALEDILTHVRDDLYNLAVRMLWHPEDAEDATQEILIKVMTKLSTFEGKSRFKTWAWRIAVNHLLNIRKKYAEQNSLTFDEFADDLDTFVADTTMPVDIAVEQKLLIEEAKIGCMQAMLLCLNREARATYILGEIVGLTDQEGAEIFDIKPATYRKRLSRARGQITDFMNRKCGLHNPQNPCRCSKRVQTAIVQKRIDPNKLLFAKYGEPTDIANEIAKLDTIDRAGTLYRTHPEYSAPDLATKILDMLE